MLRDMLLCLAGTGKTKTILGILSVIMHSRAASRPAPGGGAGSSSGAPTSELERLRLWRAASPWAAGVPNPRWLRGSACTTWRPCDRLI